MFLKIKNFFLAFILILLQSCTGGRIGNYLDSSFKNIDEQTIEKASKNKIKNKKIIKSESNLEKNKKSEEPKIKEDIKKNLKNKIVKNSDKKTEINKKITKQKLSLEKRQYQPQTYKIIFILKNVDPKDPTEELRTVLRNSNVNFEIEKIERFFAPSNKSIKRK